MGYVDVYGKIFNMNLITASHHTQIVGFGSDMPFYHDIRKLKEPIFYERKLHLLIFGREKISTRSHFVGRSYV